MKLSHLLASFSGVTVVRGTDPVIASVTDDSRCVTTGSLFVARGGSRADGATFIRDAIAKGAVAVLVARGQEGLVADPHVAVAVSADPGAIAVRLAHAFHGNPANTMRIVGVTGTNGKTTTAFLLQHLLTVASVRCGLLGTVVTDDGKSRTPSLLTTPGGCELAGLLARMAKHDCSALAMEVSSHALQQGRVDGVNFEVAIFTNLTLDHLDYHGTMDAYAQSKARLFAQLAPEATAVVNGNDPACARMIRECRGKVLMCSLEDRPEGCVAHIRRTCVTSMDLELRGPWGSFDVSLPCVGRHNAMNALQAAAAAWALGIDREGLRAGLSNAPAPPGRLEGVTPADSPYAVLVDYAHTDDALRNVLGALRGAVGQGRIITVFGCGGDRDRTKRPRMMEVASRLSDHVIVTSDNPRTEDPAAIVAEVLGGIPDGCAATIESEVDRAKAIRRAVALARRGDIVLIAGKGHEDYQIIGTEKRPFDDRVEARAAVAERAEQEFSTRISLHGAEARVERSLPHTGAGVSR